MGGKPSKNANDSDTINWDHIKTENISSTMPKFNNLSKDAMSLIASLNIPAITESQTSEVTINHILDTFNKNLNKNDMTKFNQLLEQQMTTVSNKTNQHKTVQDNDLSATSPFISSEMYDYLINSIDSQTSNDFNGQTGGGAKALKSKTINIQKSSRLIKNNTKGGNDKKDSSTSSSSSASSTESKKLSETDTKSKKLSDTDTKSSEQSGGELSYLSSSAHTSGAFSDDDDEKLMKKATNFENDEKLKTKVNKLGDEEDSSSSSSSSVSSSSTKSNVTTDVKQMKNKKSLVESDSETESTQKTMSSNTLSDDNKQMMTTSISVNTSDINMVSDY